MDDYVLFDQAIELRQQGKLDKSIIILKNLADKYDEDGIINYELAHTLHQDNQHENAIIYFEKAFQDELSEEIEINAIQKYALSLIYSKSYETASELLFKAIQKFPDNILFQILYGYIQHLSGNTEGSSKIFLTLLSKLEDPSLVEYQDIILKLVENI